MTERTRARVRPAARPTAGPPPELSALARARAVGDQRRSAGRPPTASLPRSTESAAAPPCRGPGGRKSSWSLPGPCAKACGSVRHRQNPPPVRSTFRVGQGQDRRPPTWRHADQGVDVLDQLRPLSFGELFQGVRQLGKVGLAAGRIRGRAAVVRRSGAGFALGTVVGLGGARGGVLVSGRLRRGLWNRGTDLQSVPLVHLGTRPSTREDSPRDQP